MSYNVIYLHSHDSGKFISPYGYHLETPNLEAFAENSVVFQNAFAVAPTCSPSRASLLTSTYPHENGMLGLVNRGFMLKDYKRHFVQWLNKSNFETALCGIQHEGAHYHEAEKAAETIGYQYNLTTTTKLADLSDKRIWDDENTTNAIQWLSDKRKQKPFFLSLGFYGTHRPYPKIKQGTTRKRGVPDGFPREKVILDDFEEYNESIKHVDQCIGRVVEHLKQSKLLENTIVIFTTDHGIAYPFGKNNLTDLGLEVALLMHLPNLNKRLDLTGLISHLDIIPTLCDYLAIDTPDSVRGKSLRPLIEGTLKEVHQELFFEMNFHTSYEPARAVRTTRYKYIEYLEDYEKYQLSNINDSKVKDFYIQQGLDTRDKPKRQFYDLSVDPNEKNNLIDNSEYFEQIQKLQRLLADWRIETQDYNIEQLQWSENWIINQRTSRNQKAKNVKDYLFGHAPKKFNE